MLVAHSKLPRRTLLIRCVHLVGIAALGGLHPTAAAAAKAAKSDFMYQDHPRDGRSCSQCKFFSAAGADSDGGTCAIVAGAVSRDGWCAAFAR